MLWCRSLVRLFNCVHRLGLFSYTPVTPKPNPVPIASVFHTHSDPESDMIVVFSGRTDEVKEIRTLLSTKSSPGAAVPWKEDRRGKI